jgi:ribonuclease VapC
MFLDTSAIVAILLGEEGWENIFDKLQSSTRRMTAAHVRLETSLVLATRLGISMIEAEAFFERFLKDHAVRVLPITDETAHVAVKAYQAFGKGRGHRARLNFADCLSYACAKQQEVQMLYVGQDFGFTDVRLA